MSLYIFPYNAGSRSVKALKKELPIKQIKRVNNRYKNKENNLVINWGCSNLPDNIYESRILNRPEGVSVCSNKLKFFNLLNERQLSDLIPPYTTSIDKAKEMLNSGVHLFARTKLTGHSGEGIVSMTKPEHFVEAPLYVKYIKKTEEYRVHIVYGVVIFEQRKARNKDVPDDKVNWQIRNHSNGFIYSYKNLIIPWCVKDVALRAFAATGLDFGAVDVIYSRNEDRAYVLEINTAPGLEGETLNRYANCFRGFIRE